MTDELEKIGARLVNGRPVDLNVGTMDRTSLGEGKAVVVIATTEGETDGFAHEYRSADDLVDFIQTLFRSGVDMFGLKAMVIEDES